MSWTKRQIIEQAFDELAIAGYNFDISPDELQSAARRLDALMGVWIGQGVTLPYAFSSDPASANIDAESGLPMVAIEAVYLALAIRTAASKGKALSSSTKTAAKAAYDSLVATIAKAGVQQVQLASGTPMGAGHKSHGTLGGAFFTDPNTDTLKLSDSGGLNFSGA